MRRPIAWNFSFNAVTLFFEPGLETFFSNATFPDPHLFPGPPVPEPGNSCAYYAVFFGDPPVGTLVEWRGDGGTLTLIPLPAPLLQLLGGLGALWGCCAAGRGPQPRSERATARNGQRRSPAR